LKTNHLATLVSQRRRKCGRNQSEFRQGGGNDFSWRTQKNWSERKLTFSFVFCFEGNYSNKILFRRMQTKKAFYGRTN
jgi:hypothetical protein